MSESHELRLSLVDYFKYLNGSETSRCVYEGEAVFNAGHVVLCGKTSEAKENRINIVSLCIQTSAIHAEPHKISGVLIVNDNRTVTIESMVCSCKAGNSGRCKHISAVLLMCNRKDLSNMEVISSTDLKCVWSTHKATTHEMYKHVAVPEMPCLKDKVSPRSELSTDDKEWIANVYNTSLEESALVMHRAGRSVEEINGDCPISTPYSCVEHILNHGAQSIVMMEVCGIEIYLPDCCRNFFSINYGEDPNHSALIAQSSAEWHDLRKYRITGSRCYEIYTYSRGNWDIKSKKYFWPKSFTNTAMRHGLKYESIARTAFESHTGFSVAECGIVIPHANRWLGYSPDGIIIESNKPVGLLEIKCLFEGSKRTITEVLPGVKYLINENQEYRLKKKHQYYGQIQLGLSVLNLEKCYLVLYASFDNSFKVVEVEFDYQFARTMLEKIKRNFFNHMLHTLCSEENKNNT